MRFFAYLDPQTGSLFVQALIGSVAGVGFIFRNSISKVTGKLVSRHDAETKAIKE